MADRRMFTKKITDGDSFTEMPASTQCLYFHLCMNADDDGFSNNVRIAMFNAHAGTDDFNTLIAKKFILPFESGVIVIKHWKMHNYIQNDRYHETKYLEEKAQLVLKENGVYSLDTDCIQNVSILDTEVRLGKDSIGKVSIGKDRLGKDRLGEVSAVPCTRNRFTPPTLEEVEAYCCERNNSVDAQHFVDYYSSNGWKVGKNPMKDWKAAVRTWERNDNDRNKQTKKEESSIDWENL